MLHVRTKEAHRNRAGAATDACSQAAAATMQWLSQAVNAGCSTGAALVAGSQGSNLMAHEPGAYGRSGPADWQLRSPWLLRLEVRTPMGGGSGSRRQGTRGERRRSESGNRPGI